MNTLSSPVNPQAEAALLTVLIQLVTIIAAARLVGAAFRFLGQPQVCGEIAAGLPLGPLFFGGLFPHAFVRVLDPSTELEPYFRASTFGQGDRWAKAASTVD